MAREMPHLKYDDDYPDYVPGGGDGRGGEWIRYFTEPHTKIRIAPMQRTRRDGTIVYGTRAWPQGLEHYSQAARYFPCFDDFGYTDPSGRRIPCPGEEPNAPDAVRRRSMRWYFEAVDEEGEYRVFKTGPQLFEMLQGREQRALDLNPDHQNPLSDRDYIINKTGTKRKPNYDPESDDKYPYEFDETRYHDIAEMLVAACDDAWAIYSGDRDPISTDEDTGLDDEPKQARPAARQDSRGINEPSPDQERAAANGVPDFQTTDDISEAETADIRRYLEHWRVEFPPRAQRARLVAAAKEILPRILKGDEPPF